MSASDGWDKRRHHHLTCVYAPHAVPPPQGTAGCDRNPLTRNLLASADANTTIKILVLKLVCVLVSTALDRMGTIQVVLMLISMYGVVYYTLDGVSVPPVAAPVCLHGACRASGMLQHDATACCT